MLPETNYTLGYHQVDAGDLELTLTNNATQTTTRLRTYSRHVTPATYTLLKHNNQVYLLLQSDSLGSARLTRYSVYNISGDEPINLTLQHPMMDAGLSCTYPRLVGDALEFSKAMYCDIDYFLNGDYSVYTIPLE